VICSLLLSSGFLSSLGDFASSSITLLHRLDNPNGDRLPHVTDSKAAKWSILRERLDTHRLLWHHLDNCGITGLDVSWIVLQFLATTTVNLLEQVAELAGNVRRVAVEDWRVAGVDLTWMVQDNYLEIAPQFYQTVR